MFANDTYQQFTSHTFSLQCYSTSTRIGIFAILYLRSVFSKYPHSIHDISAHCPYFPLSSNAILLSSSFYILLLSTSISFYLISLASMHQTVYLLLCACVYWDDCYGLLPHIPYHTMTYGTHALVAMQPLRTCMSVGILFHSIWYPHLPETNHNISMIESTIMMYDRQFLFTSPNKIVLC